jgi:hypothetical protein
VLGGCEMGSLRTFRAIYLKISPPANQPTLFD